MSRRRSAALVKKSTVVVIGGTPRVVSGTRQVEDERFGPMIEIAFTDGTSVRRVPTAKLEVR